MTARPDSDAECDALLVAAGLTPSPEDRADLRKAFRALLVMKERVRDALMWQGEPAHVFAPLTGAVADRRAAGAMDNIPVGTVRRDGEP